MFNKIFDRTYYLFGREIRIRITPKHFRDDLKYIEQLITKHKFIEAKRQIEVAFHKWGQDPDLIRIATFCEFMSGE